MKTKRWKKYKTESKSILGTWFHDHPRNAMSKLGRMPDCLPPLVIVAGIPCHHSAYLHELTAARALTSEEMTRLKQALGISIND